MDNSYLDKPKPFIEIADVVLGIPMLLLGPLIWYTNRNHTPIHYWIGGIVTLLGIISITFLMIRLFSKKYKEEKRDEAYYRKFIGQKAILLSRNKFENGKLANTIRAISVNEKTGFISYTFEECDSHIECNFVRIISKNADYVKTVNSNGKEVYAFVVDGQMIYDATR